MTKKDNLASLVAEFADGVAAQAECMKTGDWLTGNKHAKRFVRAFAKLQQLGDRGRDALAVLFDDPRVPVRTTAAAYLLRHHEAEATRVLREVANEKNMDGFAAQMALKHWQEGTWTLDVLPSSKTTSS